MSNTSNATVPGRFAAALLDALTAVTGALLGATVGAYFSTRLAQSQQQVAADSVTGKAAQMLQNSADKFDTFAHASQTTSIGLGLCLLVLVLLRSALK